MATIVTRAGKGSALTWTEGDANITNLNNAKIENVVEDLTPQLGGHLDVNGKQITSASNGNIAIVPNGSGDIQLTPATGKVVISATNFPTGTGTSGQVLTTDGTGNASWATPAAGGITDLVQDTTPQLGGALDVNGQQIVSTANGNIELAPNGTGDVYLTADTIRIGDANTTATLTTNGAGALMLNTNSGSTTGYVQIASGANGTITVIPNGTGKASITNLQYNNESLFALGTTTATSLTPYVINGNVQSITVNASSFTLNTAFSGASAGASMTLLLTGGTTAPTAITQGTGTWKWAGGSKALTGVSGTTDIISLFYDGSTIYASVNKGFV